MAIMFITFGVLLLVVVGMSVGVLMGREPLKGSCGGVGKALGDDEYVCDLCGNDESKCEEINALSGAQAQVSAKNTVAPKAAASDLAYDAAKK